MQVQELLGVSWVPARRHVAQTERQVSAYGLESPSQFRSLHCYVHRQLQETAATDNFLHCHFAAAETFRDGCQTWELSAAQYLRVNIRPIILICDRNSRAEQQDKKD